MSEEIVQTCSVEELEAMVTELIATAKARFESSLLGSLQVSEEARRRGLPLLYSPATLRARWYYAPLRFWFSLRSA